MDRLCQTNAFALICAALLISATGCSKLAKVREVQQDLAIDRRATVVVMPLSASASLCDIKFDEGELEGSKDYFREEIRENLNYSLSKQLTVIHPKAVDAFLAKQGLKKDEHMDKHLAMKMARLMEAEIVVYGHVKVDPICKESLFEKTKRYDLDLVVYFFDTTNDERLATLRCSGKRKNVTMTIPWLIKQLNFYPPLPPPGKPVPKAPKEVKEKKKTEAPPTVEQ